MIHQKERAYTACDHDHVTVDVKHGEKSSITRCLTRLVFVCLMFYQNLDGLCPSFFHDK